MSHALRTSIAPHSSWVAALLLLAPTLPLLWWASRSAPASLTAALPALGLSMGIVSIVLDLLIFMTGYSAMLSRRKGAVVWLGVCYLGVALLDLLHLLHQPGVSSHPGDASQAVVFWLAARLLASMALLIYAHLPVVPDVSRARKLLSVGLMVGVTGAAAMALSGKLIPAPLLQAENVSDLIPILATASIALQLLTLLILRWRRLQLEGECRLALALATTQALAGILFLLAPGNVLNLNHLLLGSLYTVTASLFLLHATHNEALARPLWLLENQRQRERIALNVAPDAILRIDANGIILAANPAAGRVTGYEPANLVGRNVSIFLPPHMRAQHAESMRRFFLHPQERPMGSMDLKLLRSDGQALPVDIALGHYAEDGHTHAIAYIRDLSERKRLEDSLRHQATHDDLTGLPNRWLFRLQLGQTIAHATRHRRKLAVVLLDLDHFKNVNDSYGHAAGDALLVQVSQRMRAALRENDMLARLGGDEFALLLTDLESGDDALHVANKLLTCLQDTFCLTGCDLPASGSMGLAFFPGDATDGETLLRYADLAMYRAKQSGRSGYACYASDMDERLREDMQIQLRLKEALATGGLALHYQPIVSVASDQIIGVEALLRWRDPVLGDVPPARFVPIAEATGLILPLSEWVLEQACRQLAEWCWQGYPLHMAVNFSAPQFRQRNLVEQVKSTLERTGAQARWLDIEITETMAMATPELAAQQMRALVDLGCQVALDDFGTGHSSLAYLKTLPVSKLKIDKCFLEGVPDDANDVALTRAIIGLAHSLDMGLVAEGVETDAQRHFLQQQGCEAYQGWLFTRALPAHEITQLLSDPRSRDRATLPWPPATPHAITVPPSCQCDGQTGYANCPYRPETGAATVCATLV